MSQVSSASLSSFKAGQFDLYSFTAYWLMRKAFCCVPDNVGVLNRSK
jgi:hypothetical protein